MTQPMMLRFVGTSINTHDDDDDGNAAAEACTLRLAAGRGHGYRLAAPSRHWKWSSLLNVNDDQSAQRDKP